MTPNQDEDETIFLVDGPDPMGMGYKQFGITKSKLEEMRVRGNNIKLAQLLMIVDSGLVMAKPIFGGAKRPLNYEGNQDGSKNKLFFIFKPKYDYDWKVLEDGSTDIAEMPTPANCVFVVIATPNKCGRFAAADFWLEYWAWVDEDRQKPDYPIDWDSRYEREITRPQN